MAGSGIAALRDRPDILLRIEHLVVEFPAGRGRVVHAVSDVSFDVADGETLGIVGESGCGKSTTARAIIRLPRPTSGTVEYQGRDLAALSNEEMRKVRPELQMIFQDPIASLNPRRNVRDIVAEGIKVWSKRRPGAWSDARVDEVIEAVGLDPEVAGSRKPHEFSGGQAQRVSVARALALDPKVIICDEPVSALDVSVQAQILNLLEDMKARYGLTLVFISHDLSVVKNISDRVMVMYLGKTCEIGNADTMFAEPAHPYTQALLDAIPDPDRRVQDEAPALKGEIPSPMNPPSGCRFNTRCPIATDICQHEEPHLERVGEDHFVACHHPAVTPVSVSA